MWLHGIQKRERERMSYDVSFKAKLEGTDQWVYVGDECLNVTSNVSAMIKEVCGSYPSDWNGRLCSKMGPILLHGSSLLSSYPNRYRCFEALNGWGTVEGTRDFLRKVDDNCGQFPTAVIEVNW